MKRDLLEVDDLSPEELATVLDLAVDPAPAPALDGQGAALFGALIGVLFITHAAAYAWALWDGDWLRVRPMFWQAPITGLLFILLPLLHSSDVRPDAGTGLALYYGVAGFIALTNLGVILSYRSAEMRFSSQGEIREAPQSAQA